MDKKDKEMQLFELRWRKGELDLDFLAIKYIVEDLKQELPEKEELLDKVIAKARTLRDSAKDGLRFQIRQIMFDN